MKINMKRDKESVNSSLDNKNRVNRLNKSQINGFYSNQINSTERYGSNFQVSLLETPLCLNFNKLYCQ